MFELLKTIIEVLAKAVPGILERHKARRLRTVGAELFVLYSSINKILVTGYAVVSSLESALPWLEKKLASGELDRTFGTDINGSYFSSSEISTILLSQFGV